MPSDKNELIPNLFRTEYSKIVSVICKQYGFTNLELAEDCVSDSFLKATETWKLKGIPKNPTAWLYLVSKNNVKDYFKRNSILRTKITPEIKTENSHEEIEIDLSEDNIKDSQLKMLFAICNPVNTNESQIALALRILCGLGIDEIANALLSNKQTINKRLFRAKQKLKENNISLSLPSKEKLNRRLDNVLHILYLLFNEGYYSSNSDEKIRKDLCYEAIRILFILCKNKETNLPQVNALMSLFCFHASRFDARTDKHGEQILYDDQDIEKWDTELINKGEFYLRKSAQENHITKYHLESLIAFWHTRTDINPKDKWENILQLYNRILQLEYSPITALNRTYALFKANGKTTALNEALKIGLNNHPLYHALLAEIYQTDDIEKQIEHLKKAISLTKNEKDKTTLNRKLKKIIN